MIITFFGHSNFSKSSEYEQKILDTLEQTVGDEPSEAYLGGYGDFDELAYDCCKKYKADHPNFSLIFVTPYITEEYQKNRLEYIKDRYDGIIYPEIEDKPLKFAITYRNRWMADKADLVICGILCECGGAYKACEYAESKGKTIRNITDNTLPQ